MPAASNSDTRRLPQAYASWHGHRGKAVVLILPYSWQLLCCWRLLNGVGQLCPSQGSLMWHCPAQHWDHRQAAMSRTLPAGPT